MRGDYLATNQSSSTGSRHLRFGHSATPEMSSRRLSRQTNARINFGSQQIDPKRMNDSSISKLRTQLAQTFIKDPYETAFSTPLASKRSPFLEQLYSQSNHHNVNSETDRTSKPSSPYPSEYDHQTLNSHLKTNSKRFSLFTTASSNKNLENRFELIDSKQQDEIDSVERLIQESIHRSVKIKEKIAILEFAKENIDLRNSRAENSLAYVRIVPKSLEPMRHQLAFARQEQGLLKKKLIFIKEELAIAEKKNEGLRRNLREVRIKESLLQGMKKDFQVVEREYFYNLEKKKAIDETLQQVDFELKQKFEKRNRETSTQALENYLVQIQSENPEIKILVAQIREARKK